LTSRRGHSGPDFKAERADFQGWALNAESPGLCKQMGLLQRLRKSWHGDSVSSSSRTCSRSAPADGADAKVQYLCPADSHAPQVLPPQMRVDAIYTTVLAKWTAAAPAQPSSERRFAAAIPHPITWRRGWGGCVASPIPFPPGAHASVGSTGSTRRRSRQRTSNPIERC